MKVPPLIKMLGELRSHEISYGYGGLKLFEADELDAAQVGYSVGPDGESFCGAKPGDWRASWIVIGHETALGDPLFIDMAAAGPPVFTAAHGEGAWNPKPVAISMDAFARCWREFAFLARGRANPIELKATPLSTTERIDYLNRINEINEGCIHAELWKLLLDSDEEMDDD